MKKPAKKPPGQKQQIIVLVDSAGNYYELPRAKLETFKVKDSRKELVASSLNDVAAQTGYINAPTIPGSIVSNPVENSQVLRYVGFYVRSSESGG